MLNPAKEPGVGLETLEVVMEVVFVGIITLVMEGTPVVQVALVAAVVVVDMVAVEMAIMDLVMKKAMWEVKEATLILVIITIFKFWTHERRKFEGTSSGPHGGGGQYFAKP